MTRVILQRFYFHETSHFAKMKIETQNYELSSNDLLLKAKYKTRLAINNDNLCR